MRKFKLTLGVLLLTLLFTACGNNIDIENAVKITLSDAGITATDTEAVQITNDIIYYEAGHDFTYGEGEEKDAHTREEADSHTVVKITKPGTYSVSGKLSKGQIAIDLGEDAEEDKNAVVNLVLNGVDITCDAAPAVIFYNVYECGEDDEETATKDVDTRNAGANVYIADGTVNTVNGSYVARIYEPESVKLSADGKTVEDADKLHKYDAAFYSKMSMNINGGDGVLNINAENEGLDSELHLTINGGNININSGNDGINTNEDNVSVTTVNGGTLKINVNGATGEGDGIDSNGWLVINGGEVYAEACSFSADAGIDSDKGIHINGGTVIATGSMLDFIEEGGETYVTFNFAEKQKGGVTELALKDKGGNAILKTTPANDYSVLIFASPDLKAGTYTLWSGDAQLAGAKSVMSGGFGGRAPGGMPGGERPEMPEGMEMPDNFDPEKMKPGSERGGMPPQGFEPGNMPEGFDPNNMPEGFDGKKFDGERPQGGERPQMPDGQGTMPSFSSQANPNVETTTEFVIEKGANMFANITKAS